MTHFLSCLVPQAVKRQSRCPEVPYHGTGGGSTEYTSCRDGVSNREWHTPATRQQIKAHFLNRKLTTGAPATVPKSDVQCAPGVSDRVFEFASFGVAKWLSLVAPSARTGASVFPIKTWKTCMNDCLLRLFCVETCFLSIRFLLSLDQWQLQGTQTGPSFPKALQRMKLLETIVDFYIYTYQKQVYAGAPLSPLWGNRCIRGRAWNSAVSNS